MKPQAPTPILCLSETWRIFGWSQLIHVIQGAARFLARPTLQKFPVTAPILTRLMAAWPMSSPIRVLFLFLFLTSLRLSSVLPSAYPFTFKPLFHLSWANLSFTTEGVLITILKSKTIICLERSLSFFVPAHSSPSVCLVQHLTSLRSNVNYPSSPTDPVFSLAAKGSWVPMTRRNTNPTFWRCLSSLGLDPKVFGWSSFRRGSASEYLVKTGDVELLRIHGDWKSSIYQKYLAIPPERRSRVITTLQSMI